MSDEDATVDHSSWAMLLLTETLLITLMISYYLKQYKIKLIHESILALLLGMLVGVVAMGKWNIAFSNRYFFNLLLPPIILHSGYDLHVDTFLRHFWKIMLFAILGTFISTIIIGYLLYLWVLVGSTRSDLLECLMFGSILSSTDPVTVLAIFKTLDLDESLYTVVFGESLLNDAVSIVLAKTIDGFRHTEESNTVMGGLLSFLMNFAGSFLLGQAVAFSCALVMKKTDLDKYPTIESSVLTLLAYSAYFFSNALDLSGIVSLLFCAITLKYYAYPSLSLKSKRMTSYLFHLLSQLCESFIFIYLGITLFTQKEVFQPGEIIFGFMSILLSRAGSVLPLAWLVNFCDALFYKKRSMRSILEDNLAWWRSLLIHIRSSYTSWRTGRPQTPLSQRNQNETTQSSSIELPIPPTHQLVRWWSGLRGAIAFALSMDVKPSQLAGGKTRVEEIRTTTVMVVVLSILVLGGSIGLVLRWVSQFDSFRRRGSDYASGGGNGPAVGGSVIIPHNNMEWFRWLDANILNPFFVKPINMSHRQHISPTHRGPHPSSTIRVPAEDVLLDLNPASTFLLTPTNTDRITGQLTEFDEEASAEELARLTPRHAYYHFTGTPRLERTETSRSSNSRRRVPSPSMRRPMHDGDDGDDLDMDREEDGVGGGVGGEGGLLLGSDEDGMGGHEDHRSLLDLPISVHSQSQSQRQSPA